MKTRITIAVTGLGLVTPIGTGRQEVWDGLLAGRSGFAPVESFDTRAFTTHLGAEVKGFDPAPWVRRHEPASLGRASLLAIAAARQALEDAGLDAEALAPERAGIVMGTTSGEPREVEKFDDHFLAGRLDQVGAEFISLYPCHMIAAHVARELGFVGSQPDDPHGLRGRQLRHRPRGRPAARRPGGPDAGRGRGRLLAHHLHGLPPAGRHRPRALPAVRPQPQGDDSRRGRGGAGAGAAGAGAGAGSAGLCRAGRATGCRATPTT